MEFSACKQFLFCKKMLSKYRIFKLKMLIQVKKKKNDATPLWRFFQTSTIKETGKKETLFEF